MIPLNESPHVFWITGLSGSGKTTIGTALSTSLREEGKPVILLDGDKLRNVFANTIGHSQEERFLASKQYASLCQMLVEQGVNVVCTTISLFHATQQWNRQHIPNYIEIFLDVPFIELIKRDSKNIYSNGLAGKLTNIVGIDITPEFPQSPDITIINNTDMTISKAVQMIKTFIKN